MSMSLCVLGAGNWGTTVAVLLAREGHSVRLWARSERLLDEIRILGENRTYLSGITIPQKVEATSNIAHALEGSEAVFFAVPSQSLREVVRQLPLALPSARPLLVSLVKGIELPTLMRMSQVIADELGEESHERITVVCGPSLAREVSLGMPTAVVASSRSEAAAKQTQSILMTETFRVYTNSDVVGVELASSLKNVIAIAAGIADGLGYGDNTRGALLTRGLAEIVRMATAMGGRRETFSGLAGLGDLVTTSSSTHSRNHQVGVEIARGKSLADIQAEMIQVAEGIPTTRAVRELALRYQVEMPIASEVYGVLFAGKDPRDAIQSLMLRRPRAEVW